jgi:hypothetical protein
MNGTMRQVAARRGPYSWFWQTTIGEVVMPQFIVNSNAQPVSQDHEVHNKTTGCSYMPQASNQIDLGYHASCHGAVTAAKGKLPGKRVNGCYYCCKECHTT